MPQDAYQDNYNAVAENKYDRVSTLKLTTDIKDGRSYIEDIYFTSPFKVMKQFPQKSGGVKIITMFASPGLLAGDTQEMEINISNGSKVWITGQSYEKIYKMNSGEAVRNTTIKVSRDSFLKYIPLAVIPFEQSAYRAVTDIELEDHTSKLIMAETVTCGRFARGEVFDYRYYRNRINVNKNGALVYCDNTKYEPEKFSMSGFGMLEGFTHVSSMLVFNFNINDTILTEIRTLLSAKNVEGGASLSADHDLFIRIFGYTTQSLEIVIDAISNIIETHSGYRFENNQ